MYYKLDDIRSLHIYLTPLVKLNAAHKCDVYTHVPVNCTAVIADEDAIGHTGPCRVACWAVEAHLRLQCAFAAAQQRQEEHTRKK
jgi:hypothetical protein